MAFAPCPALKSFLPLHPMMEYPAILNELVFQEAHHLGETLLHLGLL
jgi:hypothetical protein